MKRTKPALQRLKAKGIVTMAAASAFALIAAYFAVNALNGHETEILLAGTRVTGTIPVRIDALSGWFILIINFTMLTGGFYGLQYMRAYGHQKAEITLHCIAFLLVQSMLTIVCSVQHALVFLFAWEIMAVSAFWLVIFEHKKQETLRAGINYLIQSHVAVVFLTVGFIWVNYRMGSYDFQSISAFSGSFPVATSLLLFLCFFAGFGLKAGFVPFHTWLPYAHPAAPSHVSGIMSGVLIKIGIYGILRMILLLHTDFLLLGYFILFISIISSLYGVMLAILQHNLKTLLAYHSIENIGIIGLGIGLGLVGLGIRNPLLTALGFGGGLLHVLNHSLFKSLLFFGAGNVYQTTHTLHIESFGGLIKKMPHTAGLFLTAALAICGLPPFNGFISEFIILAGIYYGLGMENPVLLYFLVTALFGLVLVGGLAIFCFTKAFGLVFLGSPRKAFAHAPAEANAGKLLPMYVILALICAIGLFPGVFLQALSAPVAAFTAKIPGIFQARPFPDNIVRVMWNISWSVAGFIALAGSVFFIRQKITRRKPRTIAATWGCGYTGDTSRMQYSGSSFIRAYRKLAEPLFLIHRKQKPVEGIFPTEGWQETHPYDKLEKWLIDKPLEKLKNFIGRFQFLQNGNPQFYILYGIVFITLVILTPIVVDGMSALIRFLNQL